MCDRYVFEGLSRYMCEHVATSKGGRYVTFKFRYHSINIDEIESIEDAYNIRYVDMIPHSMCAIFEVLEEIV
jgi:hypothetical protein